MAHDVFISYSHRDKAIADAMCSMLEQNGIRCWYAPRDVRAGDEWAAAIVDAIRGSKIMILIFSDYSNASAQVLREIGQAVSAGINIIPFKLTKATPQGSMSYYLESIHWLDALTAPMEENLRQLLNMASALLNIANANIIDPKLAHKIRRGIKANRMPLGFRQGKWYGYVLAGVYLIVEAFLLGVSIVSWFLIDGVEITAVNAAATSLLWLMLLVPYLIASDFLDIPHRINFLKKKPVIKKILCILLIEAILAVPYTILEMQINAQAGAGATPPVMTESRPNTIATGGYHTVALRPGGEVLAVGWNEYGQCEVAGWSDIIGISAFDAHTVGLKADGTVVAAGWNEYGQCEVAGWEDIVAISAGSNHTVGLKADGTAVAMGNNGDGQCSVESWTSIAAIAAGDAHTIGVNENGQAVAIGWNGSGQCNVSGWTNIVAVAGGIEYSVGLRADGTVVATGINNYGQCNVSQWRDVIAIAAGYKHTVGLKADGTVVATGINNNGQCELSEWRNIVAVASGDSHTAGLKADGTLVAAGLNDNGQCDVYGWSGIMLPVGSEEP